MMKMITRHLRIWALVWLAYNVAGVDALPTVNIYPSEAMISEPKGYGGFLIIKDTKEPLVVHVQMAGTATLGLDYRVNTTNYFGRIKAGTNSDFFVTMNSAYTNGIYVTVSAFDDAEIEEDESIVMRLVPEASYEVGDASLTSIRLRSNPPPEVWFESQNVNVLQIEPAVSFQFVLRSSTSVTSIWAYADDKLLSTSADSEPVAYGRRYLAMWPNPEPGVHEISAVVKDWHGASVRTAMTVQVVDGLVKATSIARTLDGTTIVPFTGVTMFDKTGRAGVFAEFAIPEAATNYTALMYVDGWGSEVPHQIFAYEGDGVVQAGDLNASLELLGAGPMVGPGRQIDVTRWVHHSAGGHLGLKVRADPAQDPFPQGDATEAAHLDNMRIVFFAPGNNVPGRIQWLNFPWNESVRTDQALEIKLETFDPDNRVKSIELRASSYTNSQKMNLEVDLPPGKNISTLMWTNFGDGQRTFSAEMKMDSGSVTQSFGTITFLPHWTNEPAHRWLTTDAEGGSFYVVDAAGRAWVWGNNGLGQLGLGFKSNTSITRPAMLAPPAGKKWRHFTSNTHGAVGVTDHADCYAMGNFSLNGEPAESLIPRRLDLGGIGPVRRAALTMSGLWIVDASDTLLQISGPTPETGAQLSTEVSTVDGSNTQILALRRDGTLDPAPRTYNGAVLPWIAISTSSTHSLGIDSQGALFGWGANLGGQLPINNVSYSDIPLKAAAPPGGGMWTKICAGNVVSLAVDSAGRLFAWGRSGYTGSTNYILNQPKLVDVPAEEIGWLDLSVGSTGAMALSARGNLYLWGYNSKPQIVQGLPALLDETATESYATFEPSSVKLSTMFEADVITGKNAGTVESSSDLVHWQAIEPIENVEGKKRLSFPAQQDNFFLRVRAP
jgi:hypothetical protein